MLTMKKRKFFVTSPTPLSKKVCALKVHTEDRITNLPDDVVNKILSSLPTAHAVRTFALSRQWKSKFIPNQNIDLEYYGSSKHEGILSLDSFIDKLFTKDDPNIQSLRLCVNDVLGLDYPRKWVFQILQQSIPNLVIEVAGSIVQFPIENCFPNLKSLVLGAPNFCELEIESETEQLELNFSALEVLVMKRCRFIEVKSVVINVPKLNTLEYDGIPGKRTLVLNAPELHSASFNLNDYEVSRGYDVSQSTSMEVNTLLIGTPSLKCLKLGATVSEHLVEDWKLPHAGIPAFNHLKRLRTQCQPRALVELLRRMPNLEYLNLCIPRWLEVIEPLPPCIVRCLKEVELINFPAFNYQTDLINLFVKNVRSLDRVVIYLAKRENKSRDYFNRLLKTLQPMNSNCEVILK